MVEVKTTAPKKRKGPEPRCKVCKSGYGFTADYYLMTGKKSYKQIADEINQKQNQVILNKQNVINHSKGGHMAPLMDTFIRAFYKDVLELDSIPDEELIMDLGEILDQRIFLAFLNELNEASVTGRIKMSPRELTEAIKVRAQIMASVDQINVYQRRIYQLEYMTKLMADVMTIEQRNEVRSKIETLEFLKRPAIGKKIILALPEVGEEQ